MSRVPVAPRLFAEFFVIFFFVRQTAVGHYKSFLSFVVASLDEYKPELLEVGYPLFVQAVVASTYSFIFVVRHGMLMLYTSQISV
jgi:hypothetical protein